MRVEAEDGKIHLPEEIRERRETEFEMIERSDKIILVPVPDDPLEKLQEEFEDVDKSVKELKEEVREEALRQAGR